MFNKLSNILGNKFSRKDDLSKQLEIVKVFDLYRQEIKKFLPAGTEVRLVSLKNKVLTVSIPSSVLASELRLRETSALQNINSRFGNDAVTRVRYRF